MSLEPETQAFLWRLVEAARSVPRAQRGDFLAVVHLGGNHLQHPGLPEGGFDNYDEGDLRDLVEAGFIRVTNYQGPTQTFELRRQAFDAYDEAHRDIGAPIAAQERLVAEQVSSDVFAARYRPAFDRWTSAESLLWEEESTKSLTDIGHRCREAMQLFVTQLVEMHGVSDADSDPTKTISRLRAVIAKRRDELSDAIVSALDALVVYWGTVSDLVQRQEHGSQKEGGELTWEDGRRVLLYTAMVMTECDRVLS
jgi:hypothetical protein